MPSAFCIPCAASLSKYLLDISKFRGHQLEKPIEFKVLGEYGLGLEPNEWVDSPSDDDAKFRRVQVLHLSHHWWRTLQMSGNFVIVFADGRKLEGTFKAKYAKPRENSFANSRR